MPSLCSFIIGDDLIGIEVADPRTARELAASLGKGGNFIDVVAGIDSVVVRVDIATQTLESVLADLPSDFIAGDLAATEPATIIEIPVIYGGESGPDFDLVCEQLGLGRDELIELHAGQYTVDMLGFIPGFAYIGGLDDRLKIDRLPEPRQYVPAGSVGIAGGRSGLYSLPGPGGWPLIGRTTMSLFDPMAENPFSVAAGDTVIFRPVNSL